MSLSRRGAFGALAVGVPAALVSGVAVAAPKTEVTTLALEVDTEALCASFNEAIRGHVRKMLLEEAGDWRPNHE